MRAFRVVLGVGVLVPLMSLGAAGQGSAPASPPRTVAPVAHSVHVDVLASDDRNRPITTLKATDFEVQEDGRVQTIDEARLVQIDPTRGTDAPQAVSSRSEERLEAQRSDARLVAIFLDEYHISPGSVDRVKQALSDLVERSLGPRDLLVVMKPLESLLTIRLTHDRAEARRIVGTLEARKGDYTPRTTYEQNSWAGTPARIEASRTQVVISALNALAIHLGSLGDSRKTLFVASEGFVGGPRGRGQEYLATLDGVIRSANRSSVSIYPVDGRSSSAEASASDAGSAGDEERAALRRLADETNGRLIAAAEDLGAPVRQAVNDASSYYVLTYRSAHLEDGRFHPLSIRATRPGVRLRARAGYWAPSAGDRLVAELVAQAAAPLPPIKFEPPRRISPLIQPWFGLSPGSNGKTRVSFVWEPVTRPTGDRARRTPARLTLTALAADDSILFRSEVLPTGPGATEETEGTPLRIDFDAPPGQLRLRIQIEDAALQPLDSDVRDIPIRKFGNALTIATPEIMRARNAREFRVIDEDPMAVPVSSREFSRTEHLVVRFSTNASSTDDSPTLAARLLNRGGQTMRTLDIEDGPGGSHQFDLLLSGLAPSEYRLEITATSKAGTANEVVDFRVTN